MNKIDSALSEFKEIDQMAAGDTWVHRLHPAAKLLSTLIYIFTAASFDKYDLSRVLLMVLYPMILFTASDTSVKSCLYKLRIVLPLICAVGLFNPIFDREVILHFGSIGITGGMISMITLMLKGIFCVAASYLLIATTPFDSICAALRSFHVSGMLVTLLLLTYRYISLMMEEVSVMSEAYALRAPDQKGIHISAWGSFLGQLLLRSMDRAEELYASMQLRGFHGSFIYAKSKKWSIGDSLYLAGAAGMILLLRWGHLSSWLGSIVMR